MSNEIAFPESSPLLDEIFSVPVQEASNIEHRKLIRTKIWRIKEWVETLEQVEMETIHTFVNESYARQIFIPKGTLLVGKIHKTDHIILISKGDVSVLSEYGVERYNAEYCPVTFTSPKWIMRVIYAHEDTYWTNLHQVVKREMTEENFNKMESELFTDTFDELNKIEALETIAQ